MPAVHGSPPAFLPSGASSRHPRACRTAGQQRFRRPVGREALGDAVEVIAIRGESHGVGRRLELPPVRPPAKRRAMPPRRRPAPPLGVVNGCGRRRAVAPLRYRRARSRIATRHGCGASGSIAVEPADFALGGRYITRSPPRSRRAHPRIIGRPRIFRGRSRGRSTGGGKRRAAWARSFRQPTTHPSPPRLPCRSETPSADHGSAPSRKTSFDRLDVGGDRRQQP
jgi:hypothetical protein